MELVKITLTVRISPIKRHRVTGWIKNKKDLTICYLHETQCRFKYTHRLKVKVWKKIFHSCGNQKKVGIK